MAQDSCLWFDAAGYCFAIGADRVLQIQNAENCDRHLTTGQSSSLLQEAGLYVDLEHDQLNAHLILLASGHHHIEASTIHGIIEMPQSSEQLHIPTRLPTLKRSTDYAFTKNSRLVFYLRSSARNEMEAYRAFVDPSQHYRDDTRMVVVNTIQGQRLAIPISRVDRFIQTNSWWPLPSQAPRVNGAVQHKSLLIPILNLPTKSGDQAGEYFILLHTSRDVVALAVSGPGSITTQDPAHGRESIEYKGKDYQVARVDNW